MTPRKLNLGCGDRYVDGWVNVDFASPHSMDQRVDLTGELPWPEGSISHVYAGHLLEHLTPDQCSALAERLLVCMEPIGGVLVAVGPDIDVAERMIADGTFDHSWGTLDMLKHGAGRWAGDVHQWETTGPKVAAIFGAAGWPIVHHFGIAQLEGAWPVADRNQLWQYACSARMGST